MPSDIERLVALLQLARDETRLAVAAASAALQLRDTAVRQLERHRWHPIAEALRDGTPYLATNRHYAYSLNRCIVVFWNDDHAFPGWHAPTDGEDVHAMEYLTHYQELPDPPET